MLGVVVAFGATAADAKRTLLVEVRDIPPAERVGKGHFVFNDYNRERMVSFIGNTALLLSTPAELKEYQDAGFAAKVLMESDDELTLYKRALYGPTMKLPENYHTYGQIVKLGEELQREFPKLITRVQIGETTQQHRPIYAYRISNDATKPQDRPGILFDGCHHSDELMGAEIVTTLMQKLVREYNHDSLVTDWLDTLEFYLVPVVNVDGHNIVTSGHDPRWRKNARDVNGDSVVGVFPEGVDVNRGYDFNWDKGGSGEPDKQNYRGTFPFSESENRAMKHLAELKHFVLSVSYHSQGEVIYYPWSWSGKTAPDDAILSFIARDVASHIRRMEGTKHYAYARGQSSSQSFPWFYGRYGTFDFLIETGLGSHIFPPEDVPGIITENLRGVQILLRYAKGPGVSIHVTDAATGAPLQAQVEFPGLDNGSIDPRHTDEAFGHLWRLLIPGKYRLNVRRAGYKTVELTDVQVPDRTWAELNVKLEKASE